MLIGKLGKGGAVRVGGEQIFDLDRGNFQKPGGGNTGVDALELVKLAKTRGVAGHQSVDFIDGGLGDTVIFEIASLGKFADEIIAGRRIFGEIGMTAKKALDGAA